MLAVLLFATRADAQTPSPQDKAASVAIFNDAKKLMAAGQTAEACKKFEASLALVPGLGTRVNLGACYEKLGRTASAWSVYRDTALAAEKASDKTRLAYAREHMAALEPRLARLDLRLAEGADVAGLEVKRDGDVVNRALLGNVVPVDPGEHVAEARAAGRKAWTRTFTAEPAATVTVEVPVLESDAPPPAPVPPTVVEPPPVPAPLAPAVAPGPAPPPADEGDPGSGRRLIALVAGGVGIAALGTSVAFGFIAKGKHDDAIAQNHCNDDEVCDPVGVNMIKDARSAGTLATITAGVGLAAVATGVILYVTAPSRESRDVAVAPSVGSHGLGLVVSGAF